MSIDFSTSLQQAFSLHQSGEFDQAERHYLHLVSHNPNRPDLLQLLGALYLQKGRYQQAMELLERSLQLEPTQISARLNLANLYLQLGKLKLALQHGDVLQQLAPKNEGVMNFCATLAMRKGEWAHAQDIWQNLLEHGSDPVTAARNIVTCLEALGKDEAACKLLAQTWSTHADDFELGLHYASKLMLIGDLAKLAEIHAHLLELDAQNPKLLLHMAQAAARQLDHDKHNALLGQVLAMYPENPLAKVMQIQTQTEAGQYGNALLSLNTLCDFVPELTRAELLFDICMRLHCYQAAHEILDRHPEYFAEPNSKKAQWLLRTGSPEDAAAMYADLPAPDASNRFYTAISQFLAGNTEEAWTGYEVRCEAIAAKVNPTPFSGIPAWQGESITGKNIIVFNEQGAGDTIQFIRYLPELAKTGANVQLSILNGESVFNLLASQATESGSAHSCHFELHEADYQIPLLSLPRLCGKTSDTLTELIPYLHATPAAKQKWSTHFAEFSQDTYRIGLVWAGNPSHKNDHNRSIDLKLLDSLATLPGITWINLQVGNAYSEGHYTNAHIEFQALAEPIESYEDTAAIIDHLDLIITVDTSVAHLAGAMNKPVWTLLPFSPDWRWGATGETTKWYPSMRLFRQTRAGDWSETIHRLRQSLAETLACSLRLNNAQLSLLHDRSGIDVNSLTGLDLVAALDYCLSREIQHIESDCLIAKRINIELALIHNAQCPPDLLTFISNYALDQLWSRHGGTLSADKAEKLIAQLAPPTKRPFGHYLLALHAAADNRLVEAIHHIYQVGQFAPRHSRYRILAADCFYYQHEPSKACYFAQLAVHHSPKNGEAWRIFLQVLLKNGLHEAVALLLPEVEALIGNTFALTNIKANLAFLLGQPERGRAYSAQLAELPAANMYELHETITALARLGQHEQAIQLCKNNPFYPADAATAGNPLRLHMGLLQLLTGNYAEGWRNYEYRLNPPSDSVLRSKPQWRGEPLDNKRLLVYGEQGFGDQLFFARCLGDLPAEQIDLAISEALQNVLRPYARQCYSLVELTEGVLDISKYDYFIAIGSLPMALGVTPATSAKQDRYIYADSKLSSKWHDTLGRLHGLRVGLVWAGNPDYWRNEYRSMRLKDFAGLAGIDNVTFISLQKGLPEREVLFAPGGLRVMDLATDLHDFSVSAAVLTNLDLLITVDTSMAHLAGALGTPTWLLLPQDCDWRWGLNSHRCAWYPCMELFRQRDQGDWSPVLSEIRARLQQLASQKSGGHDA